MRDKSRLLGFTIVLLSCPLSDAESSAFGAVCRELDIPVIIARSAGLLGYVRVAFGEMHSLEPKNNEQDKMREDYWLTEFDHFPELQQLGKRFRPFFWRKAACSACQLSFDAQSCPAADSFDAHDTSKIADVPPFILLRKAYKEMRDAGSLPPRGTKLTVPSHSAPPHSPFVSDA